MCRYHLSYLFLHILAGILVYLSCWNCLKTAWSLFLPLFVSVHPVQVESVAWISAGAEILRQSDIGMLILYLRWSFSKGEGIFTSGLLYAFALLSKENSLLLLPLIVLIQFLFGVKAKKGAFFTLGAVICAWAALRVFLFIRSGILLL